MAEEGEEEVGLVVVVVGEEGELVVVVVGFLGALVEEEVSLEAVVAVVEA